MHSVKRQYKRQKYAPDYSADTQRSVYQLIPYTAENGKNDKRGNKRINKYQPSLRYVPWKHLQKEEYHSCTQPADTDRQNGYKVLSVLSQEL